MKLDYEDKLGIGKDVAGISAVQCTAVQCCIYMYLVISSYVREFFLNTDMAVSTRWAFVWFGV